MCQVLRFKERYTPLPYGVHTGERKKMTMISRLTQQWDKGLMGVRDVGKVEITGLDE